jgi:hypothetical protein
MSAEVVFTMLLFTSSHQIQKERTKQPFKNILDSTIFETKRYEF